MYKRLCVFLISALILTAFFMTSCVEPKSPSAAKITISISPASATAVKGSSVEFEAEVSASDNKSVNVKWEVTGNFSDQTKIVQNSEDQYKATLTIYASETASALTVTVTALRGDKKPASAAVTVTEAGEQPEVVSVTVTPKSPVAARGGNLQFEADVEVKGGASKEVKWTVTGETSGNTKINETTGFLEVGADEGNGPLTVTAVSKADSTKFDTAAVTIKNPLPSPAKPVLSAQGIASWSALADESTVISYKAELFKDGLYITDSDAIITKGSPDTYKNDFLSVMRKSAGVYTVKVTANSNSDSFTDSLPSAASDAQTVIQRPQVTDLSWDGRTAKWTAGTGDTFTASHGFLVKLYINGSSDSSLESTEKSLSKDFSEKIDPQENGIYKFTVSAPGDEYLVLGADEPVQSPDYVILSKVWLVGTMIEGGWDSFPPGKLMDAENNDTFTWEGEVDPNSTFRFSLTDTTKWKESGGDYRNGSWFAPETDGTEITLDNAENDMKRFDTDTSHGATVSTDNAWKISTEGWYKFIVNPNTMKLRVERPVEVTSIEHINVPPQVLKEHHYDLTVSLIGKNTDLAQIVWEIVGTHHTETSFGTGEFSNRLTVSFNETAETLTFKVTVGGKTMESNPVPVKSPANFGNAAVTLTVVDEGTGLGLSGGIPSDKTIFKTGGVTGVDDQLTLIVNNPNASHTYIWYVDGKKHEPPGSSLTLKASELEVGYHTVRLTVLADGVYWSMPDLAGFTVAAVRK